MVVNSIAPMTAGEPLQDADIKQFMFAAATTFSKGDVVSFDATTDLWVKAPVSGAGDFGIAMEDKAVTTGSEKRRVQVGGRGTVVANGAIKGGNPVMMSAATAGKVIEYVAAGTAADIGKQVGWYSGKETGSDADGVAIPDAADGDVIIITLRGRGGKY